MKKTLAAILVTATLAVSMCALAACGGGHTHKWGDWTSVDETTHQRICSADGCKETPEIGTHDTTGTDGACSKCNYKAQQENISDKLKAGYYAYAYTPDGMGEMSRFLHFYDNLVCFGMSGGGGTQNYVYDYTISDTAYNYSVWNTFAERQAGKPEDSNNLTEPQGRHTGTASHTITVTDRTDGTKSWTLGFDGAYVYVGDETFLYSDTTNMRLSHDAAKDAAYSTLEVGQLIGKYEKTGDSTAFIELYHDGVYSDMVDIPVDGKWTSAKAADGKVTYTLTPDNAGDTAATLVVSANGATAVYTPAGGAAVNMQEVTKEAEILYTLKGAASGYDPKGNTIAYPYTLELKDDFSFVLTMNANGLSAVAASGAWGAKQASTNFELTIETSSYFTVGSKIEIEVTFAGTSVDTLSCTIPAITSAYISEATLSNVYTVTTLTGKHGGMFDATLELKNDDTAVYTVEMPAAYGGTMVMKGTYTETSVEIVNNGTTITLTLSKEDGALVAKEASQAISLTNATYVLTGKHSGMFDATLALLNDGTAVYTVEMPAAYGGTMVMEGTWTDTNASIVFNGATIDITLTKEGDVVTGTEATQSISLTNAPATEE